MGGDVTMGDNKQLKFGSSDLLIYHDSNNSYIKDEGTGHLNITSNGTDIRLQKSTGEYMGKFITDGAVELYHDDSKKFETTSSGVTVTGGVTATSFTGALTGNGYCHCIRNCKNNSWSIIRW